MRSIRIRVSDLKMKKLTYFRTKISGIVLVLWALVLPTLMLLASIIFFAGQGYIRKGELEHLAQQSAQSASFVLRESLEEQAEKIKINTCSVPEEERPSICSTKNVYDFLEGNDIATVIMDTQFAVWREIKDFALVYDPRQRVKPENIHITYPSDLTHNAFLCVVEMYVRIEDIYPLWIHFGDEDVGEVIGEAKVQIDISGR